MSNTHEMIIYNIGEVVGRISVRLDQDHIVKLGIIHSDVTVYLILECSCSGIWIILSDDIGLACLEVSLNLLGA